MLRNISWFVFLLWIFTSCNHPKADILSNDEMVNLLVDIHFADAVLMVKQGPTRKISKDDFSYYEYILKKHHCSLQKYRSTMAYYCKYPAKMDKLYDKVFKILNKKLADFQKNNSEKLKLLKNNQLYNPSLPDYDRKIRHSCRRDFIK